MTGFIRKQRYLIDFTLASLARRKGKNLGLLLVYTLIVFMLASVMLFTQALRKEAGIILQDSPEIILQRMVAGRHALLPAIYLEKIGKVRGVSRKQGRLWGYFYDPAVKANYTMMVPPERELSPTQAIIGAGIARTRGVGVGDYITFRSHDGKAFSFQVVEILNPEAELVSADLVLISEHAFRRTFGVPEGFYTDLVLQVRNPRRGTQDRGEALSETAGHPPDSARGGAEYLRRHLRLAPGHRVRAAGRLNAGLRDLRLG